MLIKQGKPQSKGSEKNVLNKRSFRFIMNLNKSMGHLKSRKHYTQEALQSLEDVGNHMREEGIKAIWVTSYTRTIIDFDIKLKNILNRQFNPEVPKAVWVTDITYVYTLTGFFYLTSVMDLFSRKIIGWHLSSYHNVELTIAAFKKAYSRRNISSGLMFHSDRQSMRLLPFADFLIPAM